MEIEKKKTWFKNADFFKIINFFLYGLLAILLFSFFFLPVDKTFALSIVFLIVGILMSYGKDETATGKLRIFQKIKFTLFIILPVSLFLISYSNFTTVNFDLLNLTGLLSLLIVLIIFLYTVSLRLNKKYFAIKLLRVSAFLSLVSISSLYSTIIYTLSCSDPKFSHRISCFYFHKFKDYIEYFFDVYGFLVIYLISGYGLFMLFKKSDTESSINDNKYYKFLVPCIILFYIFPLIIYMLFKITIVPVFANF